MAELTYNFKVRKDDMTSETQRFLNEFKRFEAALRNNGTAESVLDYENTLQNSNDDIYDSAYHGRQEIISHIIPITSLLRPRR